MNKDLYSSVFEPFLGKVTIDSVQQLSGGCINNAVKVATDRGVFCVKSNTATQQHMFEVEEQGLSLLRECNTIRIPEVLGRTEEGGNAFIVMEFIEAAARKADYWEDFGQKLAKLHQASNIVYGLDHDNYIGSLPQRNDQKEGWIDFFIEKRLEIQLKMAFNAGHIDKSIEKQFQRLYTCLPELLWEDKPALLHGDMWSGNVMTDETGSVCLIDPAVYYGNREIEIAFTKLFGGFDSAFYEAYFEAAPVPHGFYDRADIYNLYPLLVHVNLFGGGYLSGVLQTLNKYV